MKKMMTAMAMASALATGAIRADEEHNHDSDCAKPTQYVIVHLSRSGMPESFASKFFTGSNNWIDRLRKGYLSTTNIVTGPRRTSEVRAGLSDAEFAQEAQDVADGKDLAERKVAARFEMYAHETTGDRVMIQSLITDSEERPLFAGEDWETIKAEVERHGAKHTEEQLDSCSRCEYKYNVVLDEVRKTLRMTVHANCITDISKEDLVAKVMAERADVERLKAEMAKFQ